MEVGLDLVAVYENGVIYGKEILSVDDLEYRKRMANAARWAFNLANYVSYPTKETIRLLIGRAHNDAKAIGIAQKIFDTGIIDVLLGKAEQQMLSLTVTANIQVVEAKHEEKEQTESKTEEKQIEPKPKEAPEEKHESTKIKVPTMKELEANIRMREKQREVKEVEKIYHDIQKKVIEEQDKK
jgi:large subunit ribosomal protein L10